MRAASAMFALLTVSLVGTAAAAPVVDAVVVAARVGDTGPASNAAAVARKDQQVTLFAAARLAGRSRVWVTRAPALVLGGRRVKVMTPEAAGLDGAALRWSTVEPVPAHVGEDGVPEPYSNAQLGGQNHGAWKGYDQLGYFETALGDFAPDGWTRAGSARPPRPADDTWDGLGTMRFKVELRVGDKLVASAGAEATDQRGLLGRVARVTVRRDDSFLGWLSSYFMVPEVFGSAGPGRDHQTDRYVGADCADVLVGALRASGSKVDYTSAAGLTRLTRHVAGPFAADARGVLSALATGKQVASVAVAPGDLILIRYAGPWATGTGRAWDHVGALWEDRGVKGVLDGEDLIVHMGHPRLEIEPLSAQSPAVFDVLRWDGRKTR